MLNKPIIMKKSFFFSLVLAGLSLPNVAVADILSPEAALNRVAGVTRGSATEYSLTKTYNTSVGEPATYLFCDKESAIVVSADDNAQPLLAILDNNSFDSPRQNPSFDYWMAEYARQIEWIRNNPAKSVASQETKATTRKAVEPLLKTLWDQGTPYNDFAPAKGNETCFTGCVATALTQVMNYHKWPERPTGSNSYTTGTNKFNLSLNFDDIEFDWDNMANEYKGNTTDDQDFAVADLMYTVGVALWMDYGVGSDGGSGAFTENVPYVLVKNFNYDKGAHVVYRDLMPYAEWEQLVYDQLSLGPVYYAGSSDDGAHAYVCDGYKDGYFHINWGWGGYQNGYYLLTAMFPGSQQGAGGSTGSYDFDQMIVADVKKPQANSEIVPLMSYTWGSWLLENDEKVSSTTITRNGQFGIAGWAQNRSIEPLSLTKGLQLENEDGVVTVIDGGHENLPRYNPYFNNQDCYFYWLPVTVPSSVKSGKYLARPVYKIDGTNNWEVIKMPQSRHQAYLLEVTSSSIRISEAEKAEVEIEEIEFDGRTVAGKSIKLICKITNYSDYDYEGCIRMSLYQGTNNFIKQCARRFVTVPANQTVDFLYETNIDGVNAGVYDIWIADVATGEWIGGENGILTLEEAPETEYQVKSFDMPGDSNNADNMNIDFTMRLKCVKGYFRDKIYVSLYIYPEGQNGQWVTDMYSDEVEINEGETKTIKFHGAFPEISVPMKCCAVARYQGKNISSDKWFTIGYSDVDEVEVAEVANVEIYNMAGQKFNADDAGTLPAGIYIVRTTTADGKTTVKKQIIK